MASASVLDVTRPETANAVGGELEVTNAALVVQLGPARVIDFASAQRAVLARQAIASAIKRVESFFHPLKAMAHALHKALCDRESAILAPLRREDTAWRQGLAEFKAIEDRRRLERERELAEQRRREDEARATAEAAELEAAGERGLADDVLEEAIAAPLPIVVVPDLTRSVEGLKFVRRWLWRFPGGTNEAKTTEPAIVARSLELVPRAFLKVDEVKVSAYVRSMKDSGKIPGLDIYSVDDPVR